MPQRVAIIGNQAFSMLNFRGLLIRDIVARGHEVFAFAPDFSNETRRAIQDLGATPLSHALERTGMNLARDVAGVFGLVRDLRELRPDVVLGYSVKPVVYGTLAATIAGVKWRFAMIEGLGHVFLARPSLKSRLLRAVVSALYRAALAQTTHTFFLNPDDRDDFVRFGLIRPELTEVIGAIGVDLLEWKPAAPVLDPLTFLFIGRLLREKGIIELIDAVRIIKATFPQVRFVLLGDVDSNPSSISRSEVEGWASEGLVIWPGQVDVAGWLAQASVFVLPSHREGVPRSTQEAMAMAKPVITTDVPGCRETVVDGYNGFLVPSNDSAAIACAMMKFITDPQRIKTMGSASREMAEAKFDVVRVNTRIMSAMSL